MNVQSDPFKVGAKVGFSTSEAEGAPVHNGLVKKTKDNLIAIIVSNRDKVWLTLDDGDPIYLRIERGETEWIVDTVVLQSESFPLVILKTKGAPYPRPDINPEKVTIGDTRDDEQIGLDHEPYGPNADLEPVSRIDYKKTPLVKPLVPAPSTEVDHITYDSHNDDEANRDPMVGAKEISSGMLAEVLRPDDEEEIAQEHEEEIENFIDIEEHDLGYEPDYSQEEEESLVENEPYDDLSDIRLTSDDKIDISGMDAPAKEKMDIPKGQLTPEDFATVPPSTIEFKGYETPVSFDMPETEKDSLGFHDYFPVVVSNKIADINEQHFEGLDPSVATTFETFEGRLTRLEKKIGASPAEGNSVCLSISNKSIKVAMRSENINFTEGEEVSVSAERQWKERLYINAKGVVDHISREGEMSIVTIRFIMLPSAAKEGIVSYLDGFTEWAETLNKLPFN